jgi:CDP-diacylglycerol--serine O-phosphatidyltransferase
VLVVLFVALLVTFPWEVLTAGTLLYLACLPFGWFSYRDYQRKDLALAQQAAGATPPEGEAALPAPLPGSPEDHRPGRLN